MRETVTRHAEAVEPSRRTRSSMPANAGRRTDDRSDVFTRDDALCAVGMSHWLQKPSRSIITSRKPEPLSEVAPNRPICHRSVTPRELELT